MQPKTTIEKPFFAQFLEAQHPEDYVQAGVKQGMQQLTSRLLDGPGGGGHETAKYPSDSDEGVLF